MKICRDCLRLAVILALLCTAAGCTQSLVASPMQSPTPVSGDKPKKTYKDLIVGYAQLGAESEWRSANTVSVKEAAAALGVELKFSDAQQKQENQIKAIRSLIAQKVDVIGVAPLIETGWDDVFREAKDAGIPIILVDRRAMGGVARPPPADAGRARRWSPRGCCGDRGCSCRSSGRRAPRSGNPAPPRRTRAAASRRPTRAARTSSRRSSPTTILKGTISPSMTTTGMAIRFPIKIPLFPSRRFFAECTNALFNLRDGNSSGRND